MSALQRARSGPPARQPPSVPTAVALARTARSRALPAAAGLATVAVCVLALAAAAVVAPRPAIAQDQNVRMHPHRAERLLRAAEFRIATWRGARFPEDRTRQVMLAFGDSASILAKWLPAPEGGSEFNNVPRYELAAYEIQKLFLDPGEYVVPPTACRCVPVEQVRQHDEWAAPTFREFDCALVTLQYWLWNVTDESVLDRDRFREDTAYARHLANADVLTYLIEHKDDNVGNVLRSTLSENPRVFVVDNSVAFDSEASDRGTRWGGLRVDRIPAETAERLRSVDLGDLRRRFAVLVELRDSGSGFRPAAPSRVLDPHLGVRRAEATIQLGLVEDEIQDLYERIQELLEKVDRGDLQTF